MFLIECPYCGEKREQDEFSPAGEAFIKRPTSPNDISDEDWADYVFYRNNEKGWHWEQWVHTNGCRKYFLIKRSTINHRVLASAKLTDTLD